MANLTNPNRHLMIKAMGSAPKESNIKTLSFSSTDGRLLHRMLTTKFGLVMLPRTSELAHQYDSPGRREILR